MSKDNTNRRDFLKKAISVAGISVLPGAVPLISAAAPAKPKVVEFVTHFPHPMTLKEYRSIKDGFESEDKVMLLISVFQKTGKMLSEKFTFNGTNSIWRVEFSSEEHFQEWMKLTSELESHKDSIREDAGYRLEVREVG